jgi:hypothetical protein
VKSKRAAVRWPCVAFAASDLAHTSTRGPLALSLLFKALHKLLSLVFYCVLAILIVWSAVAIDDEQWTSGHTAAGCRPSKDVTIGSVQCQL